MMLRYWAFYAARARPGIVEYCTGKSQHRITAADARNVAAGLIRAADEADALAAKVAEKPESTPE